MWSNLYAAQFLEKATPSIKSRANEWKEVTVEEIRKHISLTILMGVHTLPSVPDYWSKNILKYNPVYNNKMMKQASIFYYFLGIHMNCVFILIKSIQ